MLDPYQTIKQQIKNVRRIKQKKCIAMIVATAVKIVWNVRNNAYQNQVVEGRIYAIGQSNYAFGLFV